MERIKEVADTVILSNLIYMAQGAACDFDRQMYLEHAVKMMKKKREGKQAMKYHTIIFDLDGTLIDTEEAVLKTWQYTLREYHYVYPLEELRGVLGITAKKALESMQIIVDADFEKKWTKNYENYASAAAFFPGIKGMLVKLREQGCSLGIVTSRPREEYRAYFAGFRLEELFDRIVCADDTRKHKPEPEPLYKFMELEHAEEASCIYVGDMPTDLECAKRAGIASGLVLWNHSNILSTEADFLFRTPEELPELLL